MNEGHIENVPSPFIRALVSCSRSEASESVARALLEEHARWWPGSPQALSWTKHSLRPLLPQAAESPSPKAMGTPPCHLGSLESHQPATLKVLRTRWVWSACYGHHGHFTHSVCCSALSPSETNNENPRCQAEGWDVTETGRSGHIHLCQVDSYWGEEKRGSLKRTV